MLNKLKEKINDYFDVRKYRKKANTKENEANTLRKDYISALETVQTLVLQNVEFQKQIEKLKQEKKELKRIMEEEMTPKKKKVK